MRLRQGFDTRARRGGAARAAWLAALLFFATNLRGGAPDAPAKAIKADATKPAATPVAKTTNRLARETSPYLLLHAHNPVDWFPWSPEAFEKAKRESKPIFLSIGYSSCYWCHVMERLVFENEAIARTMNEKFVNIKVDREELPNVDDVYMTALAVYAQASGSPDSGGWPLSMFLTPDGKPFAGGTYFPAEDQNGRIGFPTVLARVADLWRDQPAMVEKNAGLLSDEVRRQMRPKLNLTPVKLDRSLAAASTNALIESRDPQFGGVDFNAKRPHGPKFPVPAKLALLQYEADHNANREAAATLRQVLDQMAAGGIRDHLGGGFHRYSTDRRWQVPHFEKMLYDQAQLAELYAVAFRREKIPLYRQVAEETYCFVLSEMCTEQGGFDSALDAETNGVEGAFYLWSNQDVDAALSPADAKLFKRAFGMQGPLPLQAGYVIHSAVPLDALAGEFRIPKQELEAKLAALRKTMLTQRRRRPPVRLDDKILAGWNGLMIGSLARGGAVLKRDDYVRAAERAATFVLKRMQNERGELLRTYRADQAKIPAYLDDYAYLIDGLLSLYQTTHRDEWLQSARRLCDDQIRLFWDEDRKGFDFTSRNHDPLIARTWYTFDSILPSGNSVSVRNLLRLASECKEPRYREYARKTLESFAPALERAPRSMAGMALALEEYLGDRGPTVEESPLVHTAAKFPGDRGGNPTETKIVTAQPFLSLDKLPPGRPCEIVLFVKIKEGWHVYTNSVDQDWQVPTTLKIQSKLGTRLSNVRYSKGKVVRLPGSEQPCAVFEREATIRGTIVAPQGAAGQTDELKIQLSYQACNSKGECLQPATAKYTGPVRVAAPGERINAVNPKFFPKPRN